MGDDKQTINIQYKHVSTKENTVLGLAQSEKTQL